MAVGQGRKRKTSLDRTDEEMRRLLAQLDPRYVQQHASELRGQGFVLPLADDDEDSEQEEVAIDGEESEAGDTSSERAAGGNEEETGEASPFPDMGFGIDAEGQPFPLDDPQWFEKELGEVERQTRELEDVDSERRAFERETEEEPDSLAVRRREAAEEFERQRLAALHGGQAAASRVREGVVRAADTIAGTPTPGGIWAPFLLLMLLVFALVPVNGQPRFVWLWLVLTQRAKLRDEKSGLAIGEQQAAAFAQGAATGLAGVLGAQGTTGALTGVAGVLATNSPVAQAVEQGILTGVETAIPGVGAVLPGLDRYVNG
jgi:hypothetical protein